jgi:hypothetical protein
VVTEGRLEAAVVVQNTAERLGEQGQLGAPDPAVAERGQAPGIRGTEAPNPCCRTAPGVGLVQHPLDDRSKGRHPPECESAGHHRGDLDVGCVAVAVGEGDGVALEPGGGIGLE